jgi:DnaJ-class molecular chaperone
MAAEAEIGATYRLLGKKYYPDIVEGEAEKIAKVKFQKMTVAYEVVKDPR